MIELEEIINKAKKQQKGTVGINGDEVITIAMRSNFFQSIWNSSLKTKTACALDFKRSNFASIIESISNKVTQNKLLIISSNVKPFICSNDFRVSKVLNSKFLSKFVKEDKIDSSLAFRTIELFKEIDSIFGKKKLVVVIYLSKEYYSLLSEKHLTTITSLLKKLPPYEYMKDYSFKQCVICDVSLNDKSADVGRKVLDAIGFNNVSNLIKYFNLPICSNHAIDYYKIAMELRDGSFNIDYFITDKGKKKYSKSSFHTCSICKRKRKHTVSSPVCFDCLKNPSAYLLQLALGLIDSKKVPDTYLRLMKCPDCNVSLEREGLCRACEQNYNWRAISRALDDGMLDWNIFISSASVRRRYRND